MPVSFFFYDGRNPGGVSIGGFESLRGSQRHQNDATLRRTHGPQPRSRQQLRPGGTRPGKLNVASTSPVVNANNSGPAISCRRPRVDQKSIDRVPPLKKADEATEE